MMGRPSSVTVAMEELSQQLRGRGLSVTAACGPGPELLVASCASPRLSTVVQVSNDTFVAFSGIALAGLEDPGAAAARLAHLLGCTSA